MKIIDDYKKHGYKLSKNKDGILVFESDYDYNLKHIDKNVDHPVFDEDSKDMKSKVIIHSICGRDGGAIIDGKCSICGREIRITERKRHIPTINEIKSMRR